MCLLLSAAQPTADQPTEGAEGFPPGRERPGGNGWTGVSYGHVPAIELTGAAQARPGLAP